MSDQAMARCPFGVSATPNSPPVGSCGTSQGFVRGSAHSDSNWCIDKVLEGEHDDQTDTDTYGR